MQIVLRRWKIVAAAVPWRKRAANWAPPPEDEEEEEFDLFVANFNSARGIRSFARGFREGWTGIFAENGLEAVSKWFLSILYIRAFSKVPSNSQNVVRFPHEN